MEGKGNLWYARNTSNQCLRYEGTFLNDKPHGENGTMYRINDVFEGRFENGSQIGNGTLKCLITKNVYRGEFRRFCLNGQGTLAEFNSGNFYEGTFVSGLLVEGKIMIDCIDRFTMDLDPTISAQYYKGKFIYPECKVSIKKDIFVDSKGNPYKSPETGLEIPVKEVLAKLGSSITGNGKIVYKNKRVYRGNIIENLRSGLGRLTFCNGDSLIAVWDKDKIYDKAIYEYNETSDYYKFKGKFKEMRPNGKGVIQYKDKAYIYRGDVVNGVPHGKGELFKEKSLVYKGGFCSGYKHGDGVIIFESGLKEKVKYNMGCLLE